MRKFWKACSLVLPMLFGGHRAAAAESVSAASPPAARPVGQDIIITGHRRRSDDVLGNVSVLSGQDLTSRLRPTLGETLAHQPGVSTSGSGPNVARPVLRGLSGERLLILTDGIGALDVSASSSDHAVAINPLTADSIEILHGPAALIYGASAIGGVVNVIDSRIPRRMPTNGLNVRGLGALGSAARELLANGAIDTALGKRFVVHTDVNVTHTENLHTGGFIISAPLRAAASASTDPDVRSLATLRGRLDNSDGRGFEVAGSAAYIDGDANVGLSVTRHTAYYGVPIRYSLDPSINAEQTHIDVHQTRVDWRAELPLTGAFRQLRLRGGISDYNHREIGADGDVGSQVFAKGYEGRADLVQTDRGGWGGLSGAQLLNVHQHIDGDEQYLPPTRRRSVGLFSVQHLDTAGLRLEGGVRFEHNRLDASASGITANPDLRRSFSTLSLSAGASHSLSPQWRVGLSVARSARAPSVDELFANGPHGGNASFERGDPGLSTERSVGVEASVIHRGGPFDLTATAYGSRYSNFIAQVPTGAVIDDLPVYAFRQGPANSIGFELDADMKLGRLAGATWGVELLADATRVTLVGVGPAPLIPPLRLQGAATASRGIVSARLEVEHDFAHRRAAMLELPTAAFTIVNASIDLHPLRDRPDLTLSLAANNLFDAEARRSSSLLKDYAPLAGRDIRVTARFSY